MTTIKTFLEAKPNEIFVHKETLEEYTKDVVDGNFQYEQLEPSITIKEYYEKLLNYLKEYKKSKRELH